MSEEEKIIKTKEGIDCAKQCVIQPFSEAVIAKLYATLKKRDEVSLKYAQSNRLMDKKHLIDEVNLLNAHLKEILFLP